jgi:DHA3 family macrolide efflux protein-like MFS transporter
MGRVFSFLGTLMSLAMPLGLLISGPAAETRGVAFWFLTSGIVVAAIILTSFLIRVKPKENT